MTFRSLYLAFVPPAVLLIAGCGTQAANQGPHPTPGSTLPVSTTALPKGETAATVNGKPIPMSTYRLLVNIDTKHYQGQKGVTKKLISQQAMTQVIQNEVVTQYASAHGLTVSDADVNHQIASDQAQYGKQQFAAGLKQAGFTLSSYKFLLKGNLLERKVADKLFPVKMQKVKTAHVWHILISLKPQNPYAKSKKPRTDAQAKALATSILHQVQAGGDFAGLAREYSDDTGSAQNGGDLGNITEGQTVPPFNQAAFSAPLNKATLVKSQYGYHVLEVISRGETSQPSQTSQSAQQQQFSTWVQAQIRKANVHRYVS